MSTQSKNRNTIMWVVEAALLIALLVVVQLISFAFPKSIPLVSQLITGSLVNLVLIVGAGYVGFAGTAAAAILSPVLAFAFGQMAFPQMLPVIAIGNLIIVAIIWAFFKNDNKFSKAAGLGLDIAGFVLGAAVKTAFLWAATALLVVPMFFSANTAVAGKLSLMFSWPQFITAMIGGILAVIILPSVRKLRRYRVA